MAAPTSFQEYLDSKLGADHLTKLSKRLDELTFRLTQSPRDTVLWVGAGTSKKFASLPTWSEFLDTLLKSPKLSSIDRRFAKDMIDEKYYVHAAELLQRSLGREVYTLIENLFENGEKCLPEVFKTLHVDTIVCTNYDTLLENTFPWFDVIEPSMEMEELLSRKPKIIKLHGSVSNPKNCVLSLSNYIKAYNINLNWYLAHLFSTKSVVFIGSSMAESEPYFNVLRLLKEKGIVMQKHYAIRSVSNDKEAKREGKRLETYGIELLPYIPGRDHSFINEFLNYIREEQSIPKLSHKILVSIREDIEYGDYFNAISKFQALCVARGLFNFPEIQVSKNPNINLSKRDQSIRRPLSDLFNLFFSKALKDQEFLRSCRSSKFRIEELWLTYARITELSNKNLVGLMHSGKILATAFDDSGRRIHKKIELLELAKNALTQTA